jgi:hypothetical protein
MKLYNLFENIILEEVEKHRKILSEGISANDVNAMINGDNGKHYLVDIKYRSPRGDVSSRWIQVYDYVTTTGGNDAISAFEVSKNNQETGLWKMFRLDRIDSFTVSKVPFYKSISDINPTAPTFNKTGNRTPTVAKLNNKAQFNYKYADSSIKQQNKQNTNI